MMVSAVFELDSTRRVPPSRCLSTRSLVACIVARQAVLAPAAAGALKIVRAIRRALAQAQTPTRHGSSALAHSPIATSQLAAAISTGPSPDAPNLRAEDASTVRDEPCYLSVRQLAAGIPYAEQTIRYLMTTGEVVEGRHYFKRRGRVMFSWPAMRVWVELRTSSESIVLPLIRNRANGRAE